MSAARRVATRAGLGVAVVASLACGGALAADRAAVSKPCETARKKIDRETKQIEGVAEGIARDRRARETCSSRVTCARLDAAIESAERRQSRLEARLARFRDEVVKECGS